MSFAHRTRPSPLVLPPPVGNINQNLAEISLPVYTYADLRAARHEDQYENGERILVGLKDYIFNVSPLKEFMGPAGQLSNYPWRDISFALVKSSNLPEDTAVQGYNNFSQNDSKALEEWTATFLLRFTVVGRKSRVDTA
ncbi:hypothetical protein C8F04DRAFT_1398195 [Mycena alexandri]|uniref:Cytochrome b5 heme-binding domain-containing protein n=1 Tax=Mycena alexandri TaxID=1745969 RepID=A0AAD6SMJ2_9AGAR|nr:hypothetical protein C8F04DRAFT_1398195 [Mycena alexandri]